MRGLIAAVVAFLVVSGCGASGESFRAVGTKPARDQALLFVYRPSTVIGIANADVPFVHLDGRRLGRIASEAISGFRSQPDAQANND